VPVSRRPRRGYRWMLVRRRNLLGWRSRREDGPMTPFPVANFTWLPAALMAATSAMPTNSMRHSSAFSPS